MIEVILVLLFLCIGGIRESTAQILFSEDFEGDLDQWSGKKNSLPTAIIVPDPLNGANSCIYFQNTTVGGDIFSITIPVNRTDQYLLELDYLGIPVSPSQHGNGGVAGFSDFTMSHHGTRWLLSSSLTVPGIGDALAELVDNGTWHSYSVAFNPFDYTSPFGDQIRIVIEDFELPDVDFAQDAYFDNVRLVEVPTTATEASSWSAVKALFR